MALLYVLGLGSNASADVARQPVRVLRHDLHGVGTIRLVDTQRRAVPTPYSCTNTMISRTTFCSAQASVMRLARTGPMPVTSRKRSGSVFDRVE